MKRREWLGLVFATAVAPMTGARGQAGGLGVVDGNGVKDWVAQADNVRAALLLVSGGEAPLGIVYATDAAAEPNVKIVGTFPEGSHPPIIYPAALAKDTKAADAKPFFDHLKS